MCFVTRAVALSLLVLPAAALAQTNSVLLPYTVCKFDDGLAVAELSQLPSTVKGRTVQTLDGPRPVPLLRGEHISLRYPGTDFFATVKIEQIPAAAFEDGKRELINNFDLILASGDDSTRNMAYAIRPQLNGFEVYGLDRKRLEGSTLGIYLLFDNTTHIVASVFFLNQDAGHRKFNSLAEFAIYRDRFINTYTSCVHAPPAPTLAEKPKPKSTKPRMTSVKAHR